MSGQAIRWRKCVRLVLVGLSVICLNSRQTSHAAVSRLIRAGDCACVLAVETNTEAGITVRCIVSIRETCPTDSFMAHVADPSAIPLFRPSSIWAAALTSEGHGWRIPIRLPLTPHHPVDDSGVFLLRPQDNPSEVGAVLRLFLLHPVKGSPEHDDLNESLARLLQTAASPTAQALLTRYGPPRRLNVSDETTVLRPLLSIMEQNPDSDCSGSFDWRNECTWRYEYPIRRLAAGSIAGLLRSRVLSDPNRSMAREALIAYLASGPEPDPNTEREAVSRRYLYSALLMEAGANSRPLTDVAMETALATALIEYFAIPGSISEGHSGRASEALRRVLERHGLEFRYMGPMEVVGSRQTDGAGGE
jgi:hypothetical protein